MLQLGGLTMGYKNQKITERVHRPKVEEGNDRNKRRSTTTVGGVTEEWDEKTEQDNKNCDLAPNIALQSRQCGPHRHEGYKYEDATKAKTNLSAVPEEPP